MFSCIEKHCISWHHLQDYWFLNNIYIKCLFKKELILRLLNERIGQIILPFLFKRDSMVELLEM